MPATLTLTDIPDDLYERLKLAASRSGRSLSDEAIDCLETALATHWPVPHRLARARQLRADLNPALFNSQGMDAFKCVGRS